MFGRQSQATARRHQARHQCHGLPAGLPAGPTGPDGKPLPIAGNAVAESLDGVNVQLAEEDGRGITYEAETKTVRIPLSILQSEMGSRRTKMVLFTCNKCNERTARLVNPIAWDKGMVFGQCSTESCKVWHVLSANNKAIYEEINYKTDPRYADPPSDAASVGSSESTNGSVSTGSLASADSP